MTPGNFREVEAAEIVVLSSAACRAVAHLDDSLPINDGRCWTDQSAVPWLDSAPTLTGVKE
jgi:hypothetical protein